MTTQTVAVTGGSGRLGSAVLAELRANGYETANLTRGRAKRRVLSDEGPAAYYVSTDLLDVGDVYQALAQVDADAVVHTATVYNPDYHVPTETFESNALTAFNLLEAASSLGIDSVCLASSLAILGWSFGEIDRRVESLPVDETHPVVPCEPYGLAKHVMEETADGFGRGDGAPRTISSVRFPWIAHDDELEEVLVNSDRSLDALVDGGQPFAADSLFAYIHVSDAASAVRHAIEAEFDGHERFFATAADTTCEAPTADLGDLCYPGVSVDGGLRGHQSLVSGRKAEQMLGWTPDHSWRR